MTSHSTVSAAKTIRAGRGRPVRSTPVTHCQPAYDLFGLDGLPGSPLDPSSSAEGTTSRLALDATRGPGFSGVRIGFLDESLERAGRLISDRLSF